MTDLDTVVDTALAACAPVVYDSLLACCESEMYFLNGRPVAGSMDAAAKSAWLNPSPAAVHALERVLPRPDDLPDWLGDVIDGRIVP